MTTNWLSPYMTLPYQNRGRGPAVDCWGLIIRIYLDRLGILLPNMDGYRDSDDEDQANAVISSERAAHWEETKHPKCYDVVVLALQDKPSHVGMMLDNDTFIHALRGRGVTIGALSDLIWRNRITGCYRLRRGTL